MATAKDIMTTDVITVTLDTSIETLSNLFVENRINGLPVVDSEGNLKGMVTQGDLIDQKKNLHIPTIITLFDAVISLESQKTFEKEVKRITARTVADIYHPQAVTVTVDTDLRDIATLMAEKDAHTLPVLDGTRLAGVIGKLDLIRGLS